MINIAEVCYCKRHAAEAAAIAQSHHNSYPQAHREPPEEAGSQQPQPGAAVAFEVAFGVASGVASACAWAYAWACA